MTRLIVEEGGTRRAFKVGDGVITIGSGPHAALKLAGGGVAELHAELVIQGGQVTIKPKPGVMPPKLAGRPLSNDAIVQAGVAIKIGDATITVDPPEGGVNAKAKAKVAATKKVEKEDWQRSNRELYKSKGVKPAHMLLLLVPLGIVGFFLFKKGAEQSAPSGPIFAQTQYFHAKSLFDSGMYDQAKDDLKRIPDDTEMTPDLKAKIADMLAQIEINKSEAQQAAANEAGTKFLETQLEQFEEKRLQGKINRPAARVFLKRINEFEKRWPKHPQIEWTQRMKDRYSVMVDFTKPPTYEDIEFEVKSLTWDNPRNYKEAFAVLQRFLDSAQADERVKALTLMETTIKERKEWYDDRTQQAKFEYERGQAAKAVQWLVMLSIFSGDEEMENGAATRLLDIPQVDEYLRGYRSTRQHWWADISGNKVIAGYLREHPLD